MLAQYPWASVKTRERKYIEVGIMITMIMAISLFYSVPVFKTSNRVLPTIASDPIATISIPPTRQFEKPPEPLRPSIPVESEEVDPDLELPPELSLELTKWDRLVPPKDPDLPIYSLSDLETYEYPEPLGGWQALGANVNYPAIARKAGIQGVVRVKAVIDVDGRVIDAVVTQGVPNTGLDEAAVEALLKTRFKPATQMGKPVRVKLEIPIHFRLKG